jgi:hypothetical protein
MAVSLGVALLIMGLADGSDQVETVVILSVSSVLLTVAVGPTALLLFSEAARDFTSGVTEERVRVEWRAVLQRTLAEQAAAPVGEAQHLAQRDPAKLMSDASRRCRWAKVTTSVAVGCLLLVGAAAAGRAAWGVARIALADPEPLRQAAARGDSWSPTYWLPVNLVMAYLAFFVLPSLVALPVAGPLTLRWRKPARIVLLRPFNRGREGRALRRIVRQCLAPFGHVYSLADADVRVPLWVRAPLLGGQLSLFHFRRRRIQRVRHLDALCKAISRTRRRNLNWCLSWGKLFPVAVVDVGWQATVLRLFRQANLLVFDISEQSENLHWEIENCARIGMLGRAVFLVNAASADEARRSLLQWGILAETELQLWPYDEHGVREQEAFTQALAVLLALTI